MKRVFGLAVYACLLNGCASIVSQSNWPVTIKSIPDQAAFTVINSKGEAIHNGTTPATISLNSGVGYFEGAKYNNKMMKPGYQDAYPVIDSSLNGWYWGNLLFGGLIGFLIVDPATGAMWELPEAISQDLKPAR